MIYKATIYLIIKYNKIKCMSREKTLKKMGVENNIENKQSLYFVIILLFVLVNKLFKK